MPTSPPSPRPHSPTVHTPFQCYINLPQFTCHKCSLPGGSGPTSGGRAGWGALFGDSETSTHQPVNRALTDQTKVSAAAVIRVFSISVHLLQKRKHVEEVETRDNKYSHCINLFKCKTNKTLEVVSLRYLNDFIRFLSLLRNCSWAD